MTRADRLSSLMARLKHPGPHRAADLAEALGVTVRTVYRDIDTLREAGVPVTGTRGTGYSVTESVSLPPLHLTSEEMEALQVGLAAVSQSGDPELADAAARLAGKLDAALPEDGLAARPADAARRALPHLAVLRQAIRSRQKLRVDGRTVRPLRLDFWGRLWTLLVWDEDLNDFSELQVDALAGIEVLPSLFLNEPGKMAQDFSR